MLATMMTMTMTVRTGISFQPLTSPGREAKQEPGSGVKAGSATHSGIRPEDRRCRADRALGSFSPTPLMLWMGRDLPQLSRASVAELVVELRAPDSQTSVLSCCRPPDSAEGGKSPCVHCFGINAVSLTLRDHEHNTLVYQGSDKFCSEEK